MKIIYMGIWKNEERPAVELCSEIDLSSYSRFMRTQYAEMIALGVSTIAERTRPGKRQDVENQQCVVHAYGRTEGVCGVMVTDQEYPSLVAHQVLSKIVDDFLNKNPVSSFRDSNAKVPYPELKGFFSKYQNPEEADSIMKIQKELDETKIVLHKTIQSVLDRGESMDRLADQSTRLSMSTKMFAKQAQKQNSCCILM